MFSLTASGTLGDVITYSSWKGLPYARSRVIPANPRTNSQVSIRNTMTAGVSTYRDAVSVPAGSKTSWEFYASGTGMSGFNRYINHFIETNTQRKAPWTVPPPD
jgi:hypothetical protein